MKPTLEQRLRRIEEKVSQKKNLKESENNLDLKINQYEGVVVQKHLKIMRSINNFKKLSKILKEEYGNSVFSNFYLDTSHEEIGVLVMRVYCLNYSLKNLRYIQSQLENQFSSLIQEVKVVNEDFHNLEIEIR